MTSLTIDVPAEYVGLIHDPATWMHEAARDDLSEIYKDRERVPRDQIDCCITDEQAAGQLVNRLRGLHAPGGGIRVTVEPGLAARIAQWVLATLAGELQDAAETLGRDTADRRRAADAIEWFVALNERADAVLVESVLGEAEAAAA